MSTSQIPPATVGGTSFTRVSPVLAKTTDWVLWWFCPGCDNIHPIYLDHPENTQARWDWDKNVDAPTFSPSFLTRYQRTGQPQYVCHTFIRGGKVEYLSDCTHALRGTTIDLPIFPEDELG